MPGSGYQHPLPFAKQSLWSSSQHHPWGPNSWKRNGNFRRSLHASCAKVCSRNKLRLKTHVARCCKMLQAGNEPILRQHLLLPLRSRSSKSAILSACLQYHITIIIAQYWSQSLSGDSLNMVEHLQEANFRKFSKSASVPSVLWSPSTLATWKGSKMFQVWEDSLKRPNTWWQMTKIDELTRIVSVRISESEFRNANHVAFHIGPGKAQSKARELHRGALSYAVATLWHLPALLHQRLWQSLLMVRRCTQSGPERVTDSEQMLAKCGHEHKHNTTLPRQKTMLTTCRNVHCNCAFISFELPRV